MPSLKDSSPLVRYLIALGSVAAATALRLAGDPWLGDQIPYGIFFLAIAVTAQLAGFAPAAVTTVLSAISSWWFFVEPRHTFQMGNTTALAGLCLFAAIGLVIARLGHLMQRGREVAERAERDWKETFDATPDLVTILDTSFRIVRANQAMAKALKVKPQQLVGRRCCECVHGLPDAPEGCPHVKCMTDGKEHSAEVHEMGADYLVTCTPLLDEQGRLKGSVHVARDITERKEAEAQVEQAKGSLEHERNILQAIMDGAENAHLVYLDRDFNFVRVNNAYARGCGYRPADMIGRNHFALYPHAENEAIFRRVRDTGIPARYEDKPFVYPDQPHRGVTYWDWTLNPVKGTDGTVEGLVLVLNETTARKHAQDALRRSEEEFRGLFELSTVGAVQADPATARFVKVNRQLSEITGYAENELLGLSFKELTSSEDPERETAALDPLITGASDRWESERRFIRKDGRMIWVYVSGRLIRAADGKPYSLIAHIIDITDRKRAEEALSESRHSLRQIFESIYDGIIIHTPSGIILDVNDRYLQMYGLRREQALQMTIAEISAPSAPLEKLPVLWQGAMQQPQLFEWPARRPSDDSEFDVEVYLRRVRLNGQDLIMANIRDITDRKRREEQLKEADRRKDEFLAMLAHELRNPMSTISAASTLLGRMDLPFQAHTARTAMQRQVKQLAKLVDDLLDVSRIIRGKIALERDVLDVREPLERALEVTRPAMHEARQKLIFNVSTEPLLTRGDALRLQQIFTNLFSNASRYSEPGGEITVSAGRADGFAVIKVRDNGIGIPKECQDKIFDAFVQIDPGIARSKGGLGIGLTIVKRLTELHGGTVVLESDGAGKGSTFTVSFPLADGRREAAAKPVAAVTAGLSILVVDDNRDSAVMTAALLENYGHKATVAYDGEAGLKLALARLPDVVLLDIGLPGIDGYEVARRIRAEGHVQMLVVAVTGYGQDSDRELGRQAGFDAHLLKPLQYEALFAILHEWLESGRPERLKEQREESRVAPEHWH